MSKPELIVERLNKMVFVNLILYKMPHFNSVRFTVNCQSNWVNLSSVEKLTDQMLTNFTYNTSK